MAWRCLLKQVVRPKLEAIWIQRLLQRNYYISSGKLEKSLGNPFLCHHQRLQSSYIFGGKATDVDGASGISRLKELNLRNDPEAVIRSFESHQSLHSNPSALSEYVKALVKVDRLAGSELLRTLQRGIGASYAEEGTSARQSVLKNIGKPSVDGAILGTQSAPIHMVASETGSLKKQLWQTVRSIALLFVLISGFGALIEDKTALRGLGGIGDDIQPIVETNTKLSDVKGVDEAKAELEEIVHYLREPQRFTRLGGKLPKGVMLVGPPGTGKTMLARAIAGEAGVPFFACSGSEFDEMYIGVGARRVRELFSAAKRRSPCIIFIDEIDAIGNRTQRDRQYVNMTLNQLLVELDGFQQNSGVVVIAATNLSRSLDSALVRPGRFDRHVVVPNPDVRGRLQILQHHTAKVLTADDVDMTVLARGTPGFSGAELANMVNMAAVKAAMDGAKKVAMAHFEHAKDKIRMGSERRSAAVSESSRRRTAYHEAGHALVAFHTDGALPIHKATIVPRGVSLGMVSLLPDDDHSNMSLRQMLAQLDVSMAGLAAEELIFGQDEVTSGSSSDLQSATRLARAMVSRYGMSREVGMVVYDDDDDDQGKAVSSQTRALIEREVKGMLDRAYENAKGVLSGRSGDHHTLARALLERETLTGAEVRALLSASHTALPSPPTVQQQQKRLPPLPQRPGGVLQKPAALFPDGGAAGDTAGVAA